MIFRSRADIEQIARSGYEEILKKVHRFIELQATEEYPREVYVQYAEFLYQKFQVE